MMATDLSFSNAAVPAFDRTVGRVPQYMHKAKIDTSESTPIRKPSSALSAFGGSKRALSANARGTTRPRCLCIAVLYGGVQ